MMFILKLKSKRFSKHILVLTVLAACFISTACFALEEQKKFLDIQEVRAGGMTAWLVEDKSLPIISLSLSFKEAGSAYDPVDRQGLSQLLSNMLDEGAGEYNSDEFQKLLADNSISLSFASDRDGFHGSLQTLKRNEDLAFKLLALAMNQPRFDEEALERMRNANIARIRSSLSDPEWIASRFVNDVAFAGHPYARNSGGTISSLSTIKPEDLRNFTKKHFTRDNLIIGVAGDISAKELAKRMEEVFGRLPAMNSSPNLAASSVKGGGKTTLYEMDIPQAIVQIIQPGIDKNDPAYPAAQIMNYILGASGFGSRLMEEVREKRGLTYGIYTNFYDLEQLDAYMVSASTKNENAGEVIELIQKEWRKMREEPVSNKELEDAKSYLIGSLPISLSSTAKISSVLRQLQLDRRPIDYLDKRASIINNVTAAQVQAAARRMLDPDNLTIVIVGAPKNVKPDSTPESIPNVE